MLGPIVAHWSNTAVDWHVSGLEEKTVRQPTLPPIKRNYSGRIYAYAARGTAGFCGKKKKNEEKKENCNNLLQHQPRGEGQWKTTKARILHKLCNYAACRLLCPQQPCGLARINNDNKGVWLHHVNFITDENNAWFQFSLFLNCSDVKLVTEKRSVNVRK